MEQSRKLRQKAVAAQFRADVTQSKESQAKLRCVAAVYGHIADEVDHGGPGMEDAKVIELMLDEADRISGGPAVANTDLAVKLANEGRLNAEAREAEFSE